MTRFFSIGVFGVLLLGACQTDSNSVTNTRADGEAVKVASKDPLARIAPSPSSQNMMAGYMSRSAQVPVMPHPIIDGSDFYPVDRDRYSDEKSNPVKLVSKEPVSTFSIDVDTASYANSRRFLQDGVLPPVDAVRIEEFINYFDYKYPLPKTKDIAFSTNIAMAPSPWNPGAQVLHIGIQGYDIEPESRPAANLVFLLDVSGSMRAKDRLGLAKRAMALLVDQMDAKDKVSIVVYAGAAGMVLAPTSGDNKQVIMAALENLRAGGSTAGGEGLRLAYSLAEQNFDKSAVNRVILATDGDFNVGVTSDERLEDLVSRKRNSGIYLSVLGFGRGNYNDQMMQKIAQAGNGNAAYIGSLNEARKVLVEEMQGALFPIANDVKIQVEFNPEQVAEYRLIGYETRMLRREDFNNDKVDAGEIGSGHSVTAIYEIVAPDSAARAIDDLRYGGKKTVKSGKSNEIAHLRIRYKQPGQDNSKLIERVIIDADRIDDLSKAPNYVQFASAVAGFGQLLRAEPFVGEFDYDEVIKLAKNGRGDDEFGYRAEFISLVRLAKIAAVQETLQSGAKNTD